MKTGTYYSDYIVGRVDVILRSIYKFTNIIWFLVIVFYGIEYFYGREGWFLYIYSNAGSFLRAVLNIGGWQVIALFLAPLYLHILFRMVVGIVGAVRKNAFSRIPFDAAARAKIVDKCKIHGGGSETDWVEYYLFVEHPVSRKAMKFKVTEEVYCRCNMGDLMDVNYNPGVGSVLILVQFPA